MNSNQVYVLTRSHNDYDQHGEYFVAVFDKLPNYQQLVALGVPTNRVRYVTNGGGRINNDEVWFKLIKANFGENYSEDL